jgi:hypothetical protein
MRILELSDEDFFRRTLSGEPVDFFYVGGSPRKYEERRLRLFDIFRLRRLIASGHYDLIACSVNPLPLWRADRGWFHNIVQLLGRPFRCFHSFGLALLPWLLGGSRVPVLVYNRKDAPILPPQNFGLLQHCTRFFIREVPQNNWNLFLFTSSRNEDVVNITRQELFRDNIGKIRPMPLGFEQPLDDYLAFAGTKTTDIFYAGRNHSSTVRTKGLAQLEKLRELGYRVDVPDHPLARDEFLRRCAAAHIVWSPEGLGWDCHRHYESLLVGSVPLINSPTIERHHPLEDGVHCLYYSIEGDHLVQTVHAALADKERLRKISQQGRDHILRWHRHEQIVRYMIDETLGAAKGKASPQASP